MEIGSSLSIEITDRFRRREATLGVIGLGYVGLPICLAACSAGIRVLGFDIDASKPEAISCGKSYLKHIPDASISMQVDCGLLAATTDFARLSEADALLICVPTPLTAHLEPDLSFLVSTGNTIAKHLRRGQLVVLESTTYPGTTKDVLLPILETSGLVCNEDFFIAFSPEREDPGNADFTTKKIPKIVGADTDSAREAALALYGSFLDKTVEVSSLATAEAVKLTENIFRAVNIALVNELKIIYSAMGIDIWEVIAGAKTKPFGFMPFYPGPGLGGHCIPIDPFYLTWKAREFGIATRFIELAGEINSAMPLRVVNILAEAIDRKAGKGLSASSVLLVGVAYKKNTDDTRESPALRLIDILEARGAKVDFYDPFVSVIPDTRKHKSLSGRRSIEWCSMDLSLYDAILIVTDHDDVDYAALAAGATLVIDTRNACRKVGVSSPHIVQA
jgi:UDP-N-acetyl-D-glucosamine dehydrogenase